jgi:hypothetical protein
VRSRISVKIGTTPVQPRFALSGNGLVLADDRRGVYSETSADRMA